MDGAEGYDLGCDFGGDFMKLRALDFVDEEACVAEVERLRKGWRNGGEWSLGQACWHLAYPVKRSLKEPGDKEPTGAQRNAQEFLERVIVEGWPAGLKAMEEMQPAADAGEWAVDEFVEAMRGLSDFRGEKMDAFLFGPVLTWKYRRFVLVHAAHHLGFFEPAR